MEEKKFNGYGYHGGGRKKIPDELKVVYEGFSINAVPEVIQEIKELAKQRGKTTNRFILDTLKTVYPVLESAEKEAYSKLNWKRREMEEAGDL